MKTITLTLTDLEYKQLNGLNYYRTEERIGEFASSFLMSAVLKHYGAAGLLVPGMSFMDWAECTGKLKEVEQYGEEGREGSMMQLFNQYTEEVDEPLDEHEVFEEINAWLNRNEEEYIL